MAVHNVGKKTARGPTVHGTDEAMRRELADVVGMLRGEKGEEMRKKAKAFGEEIRKDSQPGGMSHEMLVEVSKLCD